MLVVWLHPKGKASLFENGKVVPAAKTLTDAGFAVVAPDLLGTGENTLSKPVRGRQGLRGIHLRL